MTPRQRHCHWRFHHGPVPVPVTLNPSSPEPGEPHLKAVAARREPRLYPIQRASPGAATAQHHVGDLESRETAPDFVAHEILNVGLPQLQAPQPEVSDTRQGWQPPYQGDGGVETPARDGAQPPNVYLFLEEIEVEVAQAALSAPGQDRREIAIEVRLVVVGRLLVAD